LAALFDRQHQAGINWEFSQPVTALPIKPSLKR